MDARTKEAVRYLGYGACAVDDRTLAMISDSFQELKQTAEKRIIYRIFELKEVSERHLKIEGLQIESRQLCRNLKGCEKVVLLGTTLGIGVDLLMKRCSVIDMAKAVVLQACAAALLEEYVDDCQQEIAKELRQEGYYLRPRFSPGYGDFAIAHQRSILLLLDAAKKIGLTMTDSSMLTPVKSVTALIGVSREEKACHRQGCEACEKTDCIYRR